MKKTEDRRQKTEAVIAHSWRAYTLIEVVTALAMASMLLVGMGGAIVIAGKAIPTRGDPFLGSAQAAQAMDLIAGEVESAVYISDLSSTSIAFTVADRDGNGIPERIAYSWSGAPGDPLLRSYNGGSPVSFVDHVDSFNLVPSLKYISESYPGPAVEDAAPSLLQDFTATTNLGTQSFGSNYGTNFGQYFAPTFSSDVVGWRPTGVTLLAMLNGTPGSFRVQMRPAAMATLLPTSTVLAEQLVDSATLTSTMTRYTYSFPALPRLSPGDAICLTLMWDSGQGPAKFQSNGTQAGMLKTGSLPTNWSFSNNTCLSAQLYGVPMRAGPDRAAITQYLLSLSISLRSGTSASPLVQTSTLALNHPEILGGLLELKFDRDPTTVDVNGDGLLDWSLASGTKFDPNSLSGGVWTSSSDKLVSGTGSEFNVATIVDVRMQSMATGATANVAINTARTGTQYAGIIAALALQADGTQTLTIAQTTGGSTSDQLISYGGLPAQPTDLHLLIDPQALGVAVTINGIAKGMLPISRISASSPPALAAIYAAGGMAKFSYARIRILRSMP